MTEELTHITELGPLEPDPTPQQIDIGELHFALIGDFVFVEARECYYDQIGDCYYDQIGEDILSMSRAEALELRDWLTRVLEPQEDKTPWYPKDDNIRYALGD